MKILVRLDQNISYEKLSGLFRTVFSRIAFLRSYSDRSKNFGMFGLKYLLWKTFRSFQDCFQ